MIHYANSQPVSESMTAEQLSDAQAQHYNLDDNIRRMMGKLTVEQKQKVTDLMTKLLSTQEE